MITIEQTEKLNETLKNSIDDEFNKFEKQNSVNCNYTPFNFIAKENNDVIGILTGYTIYAEVCIDDLIVLEKYRGKGVGTKLINEVENHFKNKGFNNINLITNGFQAPEFYKKYDFKLQFIRENKENPKLTKYFFVKCFYQRNEV